MKVVEVDTKLLKEYTWDLYREHKGDKSVLKYLLSWAYSYCIRFDDYPAFADLYDECSKKEEYTVDDLKSLLSMDGLYEMLIDLDTDLTTFALSVWNYARDVGLVYDCCYFDSEVLERLDDQDVYNKVLGALSQKLGCTEYV